MKTRNLIPAKINTAVQNLQRMCPLFGGPKQTATTVLYCCCVDIFQITTHSDVNYMTSGIIATSCGPSLFPYLPPSNANQMTKFLIDNHTTIFKTGTPSPTEVKT